MTAKKTTKPRKRRALLEFACDSLANGEMRVVISWPEPPGILDRLAMADWIVIVLNGANHGSIAWRK